MITPIPFPLAVLLPYQTGIQDVCKQLGVAQLYAFGSICTDEFNPETSDADFIVRFAADISPEERGRRWWMLHEELEKLLARKVDLLLDKPRKNPYLQQAIEQNKQIIYGA